MFNHRIHRRACRQIQQLEQFAHFLFKCPTERVFNEHYVKTIGVVDTRRIGVRIERFAHEVPIPDLALALLWSQWVMGAVSSYGPK